MDELGEGGLHLDLGILRGLLHVLFEREAVFLQGLFDLLLLLLRELGEFFLHFLGDEFGGGLESGLFGLLEHDLVLDHVVDLLGHGLAEAFLADALVDFERDFLRDELVDDLFSGDGFAVDRGDRVGEECEDFEDFGLAGGLHVRV